MQINQLLLIKSTVRLSINSFEYYLGMDSNPEPRVIVLPGMTPRPRPLPEKSRTSPGRSRHDHHGSSDQVRTVVRSTDNEDDEVSAVKRTDYFRVSL